LSITWLDRERFVPGGSSGAPQAPLASVNDDFRWLAACLQGETPMQELRLRIKFFYQAWQALRSNSGRCDLNPNILLPARAVGPTTNTLLDSDDNEFFPASYFGLVGFGARDGKGKVGEPSSLDIALFCLTLQTENSDGPFCTGQDRTVQDSTVLYSITQPRVVIVVILRPSSPFSLPASFSTRWNASRTV